MKNIKYSALVAIAAIAVSCAKESTVIEKETIKDIPMEPMCIQTGDESETKTSLNGKTVKWTEGDQIAVFSNIDYSTGYNFPAADIDDEDGKTATFSGEVPAGTKSFIAVYPPKSVSSASASGAVVTIPSDQTPAEGTFGEELNITIAKGKKTPGTPNVGTIRFRNVCSYVKFTVPAYVSDVESVTISSDNAIAGNLTVNYTGDDPSSTIAADGDKSISMTDSKSGSFGAGKTFIFVIAPGTVSNFRIDIKTASGNWTRTIRDGFDATAGKPVNLGTVDFKIASMTATVNHTYEGEGETKTLTGTNLVIDNLNIPNSLTGYVQKVHIDIIPEGKTTAVRSADIDKKDFSTQTSIAVNSEAYPYLPQGKYTIKSTYTMSDGTTRRETTGSFSVDAPTFKVNTPSAYTNYDIYYNNGKYGNAAAANAKDGSTIYGISNNGVTISDDILKKYASLIGEGGGYSYTISDNPETAGDNHANAGDNANQTWGAHYVFAKFTFDRVEIASSPRTCHVTGLPYRAPSKIAFNATGKSWTKVDGENTSVEASKMTLRNDTAALSHTPEIKSPSFHIPGETNISFSVNCGLVSVASTVTTFSVSLGSTEIISKKGKSKFGTTAQEYTYDLNTNEYQMNSTNNTFNLKSSYNRGKNVYANVYSIGITYR